MLLSMFYLELLSSKSQSCSTNGKNDRRTALKLIYLMNKPKNELISPHHFFVTDEVEADFEVLLGSSVSRYKEELSLEVHGISFLKNNASRLQFSAGCRVSAFYTNLRVFYAVECSIERFSRVENRTLTSESIVFDAMKCFLVPSPETLSKI